MKKERNVSKMELEKKSMVALEEHIVEQGTLNNNMIMFLFTNALIYLQTSLKINFSWCSH